MSKLTFPPTIFVGIEGGVTDPNLDSDDYIPFPLIDCLVHRESYPVVLKAMKELDDPNFAGKRHGAAGTYNAGCRGPLCTRETRKRVLVHRAGKRGETIAQANQKSWTVRIEPLLSKIQIRVDTEWYTGQLRAALEKEAREGAML